MVETVHRILFFLCTCIVLWQLYIGTCKYVSHPHGVRTFSQELHLPDLTVCHQWGVLGYDVNPMGLQVGDYIDKGMFGEERAQDIFIKATQQYFYFLDQKGKYDSLHCH